ncbi:MAG: SoxR reducing system RseC family protein [Gammaproteobacteria bacterium]|nr:SoxR reducing system RseC family protein [Gammaproteobacteria bacterium]
MTADAVVVAATADGRVDLEFAPTASCAGCAGTCLWKRLTATRLERVAAAGLATGDEVTVALPERSVLSTSLLLHGVPLLAILIGAAAGAAVTGSDIGTLIGAVGMLVVVVAVFGRLRDRVERATLRRLVVSPRS